MKRKAAILVLAIIAIFALSACGSVSSGGNDYISIVQDGAFFDYPDTFVGDAFDDFFIDPTWEYFVSEEDEHIVEFNGEAEYIGENVNICLQFEVNPDTDEFEVVWADINEYEMSDADYNDLIDTIFSY
ncbi:hypothetical protein [Ornithinibacillus californiensis]|uniref:hypothetical protein n=1 Tax=Ornithinibacillus californiensis TaxID=161536 RepID=UPI00064D8B7B|nr:hypothetical protein [Ornithinibacillus californiensis]